MGVCTAFVFAALVEFTFVNYLWRKTSEPYWKFERFDTNGERADGGGRTGDMEMNMVRLICNKT